MLADAWSLRTAATPVSIWAGDTCRITGLWGCAASRAPMPAEQAGKEQGALLAELFAISMVATSVEGTAVVVSDSLNAIGYAQAWLDGEVSGLPQADTKPEMILYTQWERRAARRQEELAGYREDSKQTQRRDAVPACPRASWAPAQRGCGLAGEDCPPLAGRRLPRRES